MPRDIPDVFHALGQSAFRRRFRLLGADREYLEKKGLPMVMRHAHEFIGKRLAVAEPQNDGKQTPWRGHPVFVAQHGTGTCCRGCLEKWHAIAKGQALTEDELQHVYAVIERWLKLQLTRPGTDSVEGTIHRPTR